VTAQNFIFRVLKDSGALSLAAVMTFRQFLAVVLSCIRFGHHISSPQWGAIATIFAALFYRSRSKLRVEKPV